MADRPLTVKQEKFVQGLFAGLSQREAYREAYPSSVNWTDNTVDVKACQAAATDKIKLRLKELQDEFKERNMVTAEKILQKWWDIVEADPNDIIHIRRVCCRYCFGIDFQYQWRDEAEYERACQNAIAIALEAEKVPVLPSNAGGYGFDKLLRPHPKCPWCSGEGKEEVHVEDTRFLPPKAKALFAGVKVTQAGIEIKFHDQAKAMENAAKHLGMFVERKEITGADGGPIIVKLPEELGDD